MKQRWPAPERNKGPIHEVLERVLPSSCSVLEIAAGTGQHALHFATEQPGWTWLASDPNPEHVASIAAYGKETDLENLQPPVSLDVLDQPWPVAPQDAVFCANMIHIAPWECGRALITRAPQVLRAGGLLILYGPFRIDGKHTSQSNEAFDQSLRSRDPTWGVRDLSVVHELARSVGLTWVERVAMPANNQMVIWRLTDGLEQGPVDDDDEGHDRRSRLAKDLSYETLRDPTMS